MLIYDGERGRGPEGADDLCSVIFEDLGLIVAKALDGQRYPLPLCEYMGVCVGERGSGPEGADDLCFVSSEALGCDFSHEAVI